MARLTEERLAREIEKHRATCEQCETGRCDGPDEIEASFWNEVDRQIDDDRERER